MFHEDILYISILNISKHNFWLVICIAKNLIWTTLKATFCNLRFRIFKSLYRGQIFSYPNRSINQMKALSSFQIMYKSQFQKNDLYDWFCGPGSPNQDFNKDWPLQKYMARVFQVLQAFKWL